MEVSLKSVEIISMQLVQKHLQGHPFPLSYLGKAEGKLASCPNTTAAQHPWRDLHGHNVCSRAEYIEAVLFTRILPYTCLVSVPHPIIIGILLA